jgi:hypothetical protein
MRAQQQASPAEMKSIGIGFGIAGLCGILVGCEVLPVPGGRDNLHGPLWLATLTGLIVLLAGAACVLQGVGRASASAELPADAPFWMRAAQYLIGVALFANFAVLGTWVAFLGEDGHFSGGVALLGAFNVSLVRIMFGVGALICWLATIGYAVAGARKLLSHSGQW